MTGTGHEGTLTRAQDADTPAAPGPSRSEKAYAFSGTGRAVLAGSSRPSRLPARQHAWRLDLQPRGGAGMEPREGRKTPNNTSTNRQVAGRTADHSDMGSQAT